MGAPLQVEIGRRFGRLRVVREDSHERGQHRRLVVVCDCGKERSVNMQSLLRGATNSCGCFRKETTFARTVTHGARRWPEYRAWANAKDRCYNPKIRNFPEYGGRGITMCERWRSDFAAFLADMGRKPTPKHSLDRIDGDGNYEPGNCRWADPVTQVRNRRTTRTVTAYGITMPLAAWSEQCGSDRQKIWQRIHRDGWTPERAVHGWSPWGEAFPT